jgi:hypothetical protein
MQTAFLGFLRERSRNPNGCRPLKCRIVPAIAGMPMQKEEQNAKAESGVTQED